MKIVQLPLEQFLALVRAIVLVVWGNLARLEYVKAKGTFLGRIYSYRRSLPELQIEVEETSRRRCRLLLLQRVSEALTYKVQMEIVHDFLGEVYELVAKNRSKEAMALIFNFIDTRMLEDRFQEVDTIFCHMKVKRLDPHCMVGFLSITYSDLEHLRHWNGLRLRCREECASRGMEEEKLARLFDDDAFMRRHIESKIDPELAPEHPL